MWLQVHTLRVPHSNNHRRHPAQQGHPLLSSPRKLIIISTQLSSFVGSIIGDGMVHAFYLEDGKARYRNRWVESAGLLAERKRGRACFGSVSEFRLPDEDILQEAGMMKNNAN